jgi:hypothetical protein
MVRVQPNAPGILGINNGKHTSKIKEDPDGDTS